MDLSVEESTDVNAVAGAFSVHLDNFDGPFDLLLQLISRHKMDITEISLSLVTDEFIAFIRALEATGEGWRLDQATEFLVVAATLLDLKAARLLPSGEVEDEEDLALLEARDILFARLLQYRAFKEIAATFSERITVADKFFPRVVALDSTLSALLPEVLIGVGPARFAAIAERVHANRDTRRLGRGINRPVAPLPHRFGGPAEEQDLAELVIAGPGLDLLHRQGGVLVRDHNGAFEALVLPGPLGLLPLVGRLRDRV